MEKDKIMIEEFHKICRTCLRNEDLKPLFETNLDVILSNIAAIEIKLEDKLPTNVCASCLKHLENISVFIETCKSNDAYLRQILAENQTIDFYKYEDKELSENSESSDLFVEENMKIQYESELRDQLVSKKKIQQNKGRIKRIDIKKVKKKRIEECSCNTCGKKFTRRGGLKRHSKIHLGIKPFECKTCGKTFVEKATLNRHNLTHTGEKPFECNLCGKASTRKDQIIEHINKHHSNVIDYDFVITEHKKEEWSIKESVTATSDVFEKKLNNNKEFKETAENVYSEEENEVRQFKTKKRVEICLCNLCGKVFRRRGYLKNHMAIHSKIKPYICIICGKGFTQRHALTRHNLVHTKERPFQCNLCGKTFTRKEILNEHLKNHEEGKKPYLCFHCGKCFSNKDYLTKHLKYFTLEKGKRRENTEDKKCICPHCGKQLHSVSYLKTHILTHTGEKPFECNICGDRFTVQRSLNHHLNIHKGIKPYQCTQCDKAFRTSSSLRKHILLHTGERPFQCTSCDKGFIRHSHLKRHLRTHCKIPAD